MNLGGCERASQHGYVVFPGQFNHRYIQTWAGKKTGSGVEASAGSLGVEDGACANQDFGDVFGEIGDHVDGARYGHGDFNNGDAAAGDGVGGEVSVFGGDGADAGDDADLVDAR